MKTRLWWGLAEFNLAGVWSQGGSVLYWCVWQESGFNRREDVFTINLNFKAFYILYTFRAICKDNATTNCITVEHKKDSIPSTLTGHMLA
jgi:hypothetical protein